MITIAVLDTDIARFLGGDFTLTDRNLACISAFKKWDQAASKIDPSYGRGETVKKSLQGLRNQYSAFSQELLAGVANPGSLDCGHLETADKDGKTGIVSQKLQFAAIDRNGNTVNAGIAPHLNLRPAASEEIALVDDLLQEDWLTSELEKTAVQFATVELAQHHVAEVKARRLPEIEKVEQEVRARLSKEINYWDSRAFELKEEEKAGKKTRLNWQNAQRRAEDLAERLKRRQEQLEEEKFITSQPPRVRGGMVVIPRGLLEERQAATSPSGAIPKGFAEDPAARREIELAAMGSAPTHKEENKGLDDKQINLGVVQPGERPAIFGDALRRLTNQAKFMHSDLGRYWYSMSASLNRIAADRAGQLDEALVLMTIDEELTKYINGLADRGHFDTVQVAPSSSADVPDDAGGVRAVVLGVAHPHTGRDGSEAMKNRTAVEFRFPDLLVPYLEHYLAAIRPRFLNALQHDGLWPSCKGSAMTISPSARR